MTTPIINGFPKSGNHALLKACQLLGLPIPSVNHLPYSKKTSGKHILIIRDPRNILVSKLRFEGSRVTPGMVISKFRLFDKKSLVEEMAEYEGWLTDPDTLVVKFEELVSDPSIIKKIAEFVDTPYIEGAFEELPGLTRTWTGALSNYQDYWTQDVANVWDAEGGPELLKRWNY